jgi:hypothetical protein
LNRVNLSEKKLRQEIINTKSDHGGCGTSLGIFDVATTTTSSSLSSSEICSTIMKSAADEKRNIYCKRKEEGFEYSSSLSVIASTMGCPNFVKDTTTISSTSSNNSTTTGEPALDKSVLELQRDWAKCAMNGFKKQIPIHIPPLSIGHNLKLRSAYASNPYLRSTGEPGYTTAHSSMVGCVDYIFYTENLTPLKILEPYRLSDISEMLMPQFKIPSDHCSLIADFAYNNEDTDYK